MSVFTYVQSYAHVQCIIYIQSYAHTYIQNDVLSVYTFIQNYVRTAPSVYTHIHICICIYIYLYIYICKYIYK